VRAAVLVCMLAAGQRPAGAGVELRIHYTALQRILADQMFTQDGRRYVRGAPGTSCNYAYLEHPGLSGEAGGRLNVRARFSGRSAVDLFGRCVGMGDSFDVSITAMPYFDKGAIRFKDVVVESRKDSFYIRHVRAALASTLRNQFAYKVADDARKILEEKRGNYTQELSGFQVSAIQAAADALVLTLDFTLVVK
jgi:hypothetical protein